ncbi:histidine kinase [Winogradskyella maritima]|uniref:Sensor histidine kinase n=1 Tax=Winogradskyella maritima TaxID=1517766 RepID=A0ABV8AKU8_9FLAO|nr:histidine kinase [Winogradskyella maritima]
MKYSIILFLYLAFLIPQFAEAQHPVFYHLTEDTGLPDEEFYQVLEDLDGFIWLAANKGLFKYDGKTFELYSHPEQKGLSVFNLRLDNAGRLWYNNISGQFFYIENQQIHLFKDLEESTNGQLSDFYVSDSDIILNTVNGLLAIDRKSKSPQKLFDSKIIPRAIFHQNDSLFFIKNQALNLTTNLKDVSSRTVLDVLLDRKFTHVKIINIPKGKLVYALNSEVRKAPIEVLWYKNDELLHLDVQDYLKDRFIQNAKFLDGKLWFCTDRGLIAFDYISDSFVYNRGFFESKSITDIIVDKFGNYWVTTLEDGIYLMPNLDVLSYNINEAVTAFEVIGESELIYGTKSGSLKRLDINNGSESEILVESGNRIVDVSASNANVFVASGPVSFLYDKYEKRISKIPHYNFAKEITAINDSAVIYTLSNGANITTLNNPKIITLRNKRAYTSFFDSKFKTFYVGFVDGLKQFYTNNESIDILYNGTPIFAIDMTQTDDGIVWVSTFSDGVLGIDDGKVIQVYNTENGLLSNRIMKINSDGNDLWIVSDQGIQGLDIGSKTMQNLTKRDGIVTFNISDIAISETSILVSTNQGILKILKDRNFKPKVTSDFYFSDIKIENKFVPSKTEYVLNSDENKIQFKLSTNGFLAEENLKYFYKLEKKGIEESWSEVTNTSSEIIFDNLASGKYLFSAKSVDLATDFESEIKTTIISILKPFYLRWWFLMLSSLLILLSFYIYFLKRISKIKTKQKANLEKERLERQLASSKLESLQAQMNPHFTFNALNSIQNLVLKGDREQAYSYLTTYADLIRRNLNHSKKTFIDFHDEVETIKRYLELEKLRFRENFEYSILVDTTIGAIEIPAMIIQPFIENAIKHGLLHKTDGLRLLNIEFRIAGVLECIILDNGVGFQISKEINLKNNRPSSFSTQSIREKLEIIRKIYKMDIGFEYEDLEQGTKVTLKIPFNRTL